MEVVVLIAAIAGVALIAVGRLQRRRPAPIKARRPVAAPAKARPAVVASWTPADGDAWEDDLGWEGEETASGSARAAWEQWRATESPLAEAGEAPAPIAPPEPVAELPSVERWRARADEDWVEDDDGLGWEGEDGAPAAPALWNGNGHARASGTAETPAFATASATEPRPARELAAAGAPIGTAWGASEATAPAPPRRPKAPRRARMHPVLLIAIYAAAGIGAVALASTALLGGSTDAKPVVKKAPRATATPQRTPAPAADAELASSLPLADARTDFGRAHSDAVRRAAEQQREARARAAAQAKAREKARRKAAEKRRRERAREAARAPWTPPAPAGGGTTSPPPTYTPPASTRPRGTTPAPAKKRSSGCEFCIG